MKISAFILMLFCYSISASAQIERKPVAVKADTASQRQADAAVNNKKNRRDQLKDLDLTKEQRSKLKEIRESNQAAKAVIDNNSKLSDAEKKKQLRVLQKEQAQKIQSILTEEQKAKFKAGRQDNP